MLHPTRVLLRNGTNPDPSLTWIKRNWQHMPPDRVNEETFYKLVICGFLRMKVRLPFSG